MVTTSVLPGRGMTELSTRPSKIRLGPPRWISHRRVLFFDASRMIASKCIFLIGARLGLQDAGLKRQLTLALTHPFANCFVTGAKPLPVLPSRQARWQAPNSPPSPALPRRDAAETAEDSTSCCEYNPRGPSAWHRCPIPRHPFCPKRRQRCS